MVSIRRKLGAFGVAMAIAAAMVVAPEPVHARGTKSGDTLAAFCAQLTSAIDYVSGLPSNLVTDLVLQSLNATYDAYCR
jgi:hypothetical protein